MCVCVCVCVFVCTCMCACVRVCLVICRVCVCVCVCVDLYVGVCVCWGGDFNVTVGGRSMRLFRARSLSTRMHHCIMYLTLYSNMWEIDISLKNILKKQLINQQCKKLFSFSLPTALM